jgi:chromosome segregation ATPase
MTRDWLQNHNIDDASEIISYNNELETQLTRAKSDKDELFILNENLSEKCDMLTSQNSQLKAQLHEREEQCNIVLDRLMTIEKELQSDRNAMQTTIDAKQRLIDQQKLRIQQLENEIDNLSTT